MWYLNHWQVPYRQCFAYRVEKAPYYHSQTLNIPSTTHLEEEDKERVVSVLKKVAQRYGSRLHKS